MVTFLVIAFRTSESSIDRQKVEEWYHVDVQRYTVPVAGTGEPWMFDYDSLFQSFNLSPEVTDEEVAVQMMYDAQNAPDGQQQSSPPQATDSTADAQGYSSASDDEELSTAENIIPDENSTNLQTLDPNVNNLGQDVVVPDHPVGRIDRDHPQDNIIGDPATGVRTRHQIQTGVYAELMESGIVNEGAYSSFVSQIEPHSVTEALRDEHWVNAMQEELLQFEKLGVWRLVDLPKGTKKIGTKWVLKCK